MKIKVLFIISTLETSGPTNILYNIISNINRQLFDPIILTLSEEPIKSRKKDFINQNVLVLSLNLNRIKGFLWAKKKLLSLVQQVNPDLIHTHSYRADVLAVSYLQKYPIIATLHSNLIDNYTDTYGKLMGHAVARHQLSALKKTNLVVTCSKTLYYHYKKIFRRSTFVQNGVDASQNNLETSPVKFNKKMLAANFNIPPDKTIFISVGSLTNRKDPLTLIKGFKACNIFQDSVLYLAGEGPLKPLCQEVAKDCPNIVFLGQINNVNDYLKISDYYISSSKSEGLPTSVLEALSFGLPVILSNIKPHQEIFELAPTAVHLFEPTNTSQLVKIIDNLRSFPYKEASSAALSIINDNLNAKNMASKYENIYFSLLDSNN